MFTMVLQGTHESMKSNWHEISICCSDLLGRERVGMGMWAEGSMLSHQRINITSGYFLLSLDQGKLNCSEIHR